jgi:tellurite resistance protein TerA
MQLIRGQKIKLSELTGSMQLELHIRMQGNAAYDVSCFGLDLNGKLSDDRFFIFFNQLSSPDNCIKKLPSTDGIDKFSVSLQGLSPHVKRMVFTVATEGAGTMSDIRSADFTILVNGAEVAAFTLTGKDFAGEKAVMLAEIYFKDIWRFAAVGQGFNGGLSALLKHFGGEEAATPPSPPTSPTPPPSKTTAPSSGPVSLTKVTLEKRGEKRTVSLEKKDQRIHINLNWETGAAKEVKKGFFSSLMGGNSGGVDLDLGCMFELKNGLKGVIQPLGRYLGSSTTEPFILLDKDDRSGSASDGENMVIHKPDIINRVLIFALIYEGTALFSQVNGRLTIKTNQEEILIRLDNPDATKRFCVVGLFENKGAGLVLSKEERYFEGHAACDAQYGFGFEWRAGSK